MYEIVGTLEYVLQNDAHASLNGLSLVPCEYCMKILLQVCSFLRKLGDERLLLA